MKIYKEIDENLNNIKVALSIPLSMDAILREFAIIFNNKKSGHF